jgi:hypothetical protein
MTLPKKKYSKKKRWHRKRSGLKRFFVVVLGLYGFSFPDLLLLASFEY